MESVEYKGKAEFHSVTDMNCGQEGEALDLDEQGGSNPSSDSLMVIKVTYGALIPAFIHTTETVRAVCMKAFLPEPVHVSFFK